MTAKTIDVLSNEVDGLKNDVREVKDEVAGMRKSVSDTLSRFSDATSNSIKELSEKISTNQTTKWHLIWPAAGVAVGVLATIAGQALSPIVARVSVLEQQVVPRVETELRYENMRGELKELRAVTVPRAEYADRIASIQLRFANDEAWLRRIDTERYQEQQDELKAARAELRELRKK